MKRRKEKLIRCLAYLAVNRGEGNVELKEEKQLRYLREYAAAHNIQIVQVYHRGTLGQYETERHFDRMRKRIERGEAEGILLANIGRIAVSLEDAYRKAGLVAVSGGVIITVDEGKLCLEIKELGGVRR